jgi:hypothetical protein
MISQTKQNKNKEVILKVKQKEEEISTKMIFIFYC